MFILTLIVFTNGSCISTIGNLLADTLIDPKNELIKLAPYIYFSGKGYILNLNIVLMILDYMKTVLNIINMQ